MVDEDTCEAVADGLVEKHGTNGRVYTARKTEDYAVVAELLLQFCNRCLHERGCAPLLTAAADVHYEIAEQEGALGGVINLGVELNGKDGCLLHFLARGRGSPIGGVSDVCRGCYGLEPFGDGGYGVAMTHPNLRASVESLEERVVQVYLLQMGAPVLTGVCLLHLASEGVADELCAIADAQHGNTAHEATQVHLERLWIVYRIRRAAEDDANNVGVVLGVLVVRQYLAERVHLADASSDELCGLTAEVQNNYLL